MRYFKLMEQLGHNMHSKNILRADIAVVRTFQHYCPVRKKIQRN